MTRSGPAAGILVVALVVGTSGVAWLAGPAHGQTPDDSMRIHRAIPVRPLRDVMSPSRGVPDRPSPSPPGIPGAGAAIAQRPWTPLPPARQQELAQALGLFESGQYEAARQRLQKLLGAVPHHPLVLTALARVLAASADWTALERLARPERAAQKDSLLLAGPLSFALERLGRVREAAQPLIEAWAAAPNAGWAGETLVRLAPADAKGVREALRAAAARRPGRTDMAVVLARLDWQSGDGAQALRTLAGSDGPDMRPPLRWSFAEELLRTGTGRDSTGAAEAFLAVAEDARLQRVFRIQAVQRAWAILTARRGEVAAAPRAAHALADVPVESWNADFLVDLARALRRGGRTTESRALLGRGQQVDAVTLALERALADLRDGPPERALDALRGVSEGSPEGAFRYAEALFFAGNPDSALTLYQRVAKDAAGAWTGAALERMFLIEDAQPREALIPLGRMAWEEWRGEPRRAAAIAESLFLTQARGPIWAQAALRLSALRDAAGDAKGALVPLLAVADSLSDDRLAPLARQRAGDLYLDRLKDERQALAQYEECLARYPRAWNAPEVRRRVETLRRERRF